MTTLITGATGRVGRELLSRLHARGERIRALALPDDPGREALMSEGVEVVVGSLTDRAPVQEAVAGVDRVVHLAAVMLWGEGADRQLFEQNVAGTFNLLDAIVERGTALERFFLASSDEVYPSLKAGFPADRRVPPPQSLQLLRPDEGDQRAVRVLLPSRARRPRDRCAVRPHRPIGGDSAARRLVRAVPVRRADAGSVPGARPPRRHRRDRRGLRDGSLLHTPVGARRRRRSV